jgi:hypothetical protein
MPVLALMASNLGVVPLIQGLRPLILSLTAAILLQLLFSALLRDGGKAAVLSLTCLVLFFSYGHAHIAALATLFLLLQRVVGFNEGTTLAVWLHPFLIALCVSVFLLVLRAVRRGAGQSGKITRLLNLVTALLLLYPAVQVLRYGLSLREVRSAPSHPEVVALPVASEGQSSPDIYYIILDGYGAELTLQEVYYYDNLDFLQFLSSQGFYVASESTSNYAQTILSLTSSLNLDYLDEVLGEVDRTDVNILIPLLRNNQVRSRLASEGYRFIAFSTGYGRTEIPNADVYLQPNLETAGTLESLLIESTFMRAVEAFTSVVGARFPYPGYEAHRQRALFTLEQLPMAAEIPGPKFVFAHILLPHPPFVFGPEGEELVQRHGYELADGSDFLGTYDEYIEGYRGQVSYLNSSLEEIIPRLIGGSPVDPIIILQGDHGPGAGLDWRSPTAEGLSERFRILNAIRLPGAAPELLYPAMSPVNTFRVILNQYFGTSLGLLPDRSYFSTTSQPLEFQPVQP